MFIDDYPFLEDNRGGDTMNMKYIPCTSMPWYNYPMHNPYMNATMPCPMDNINYGNMNKTNNNITTEKENPTSTRNQGPVVNAQSENITDLNIQTPPPVQDDILYNQGFLKTQIGKRVKIEFLIGTNMLIDREGTLVGVGISYILLDEVDTNDLIMADMYSIKFVRIFD